MPALRPLAGLCLAAGAAGWLGAASDTQPLQAKAWRWGAPVTYECDAAHSDLKVWVSKRGLLSAAGHNLVLRAPRWRSTATLSTEGQYEVAVEVDAAGLEVWNKWDPVKEGTAGAVPGVAGAPVRVSPMDAWSIGQIHGTMRGKDVLDVAKFPTVVYRGTGLRHGGGAGLQFEGTLALKGVEKPLKLQCIITPQADDRGRPQFVMTGECTFL
eukprot:EG_transcript_29757